MSEFYQLDYDFESSSVSELPTQAELNSELSICCGFTAEQNGFFVQLFFTKTSEKREKEKKIRHFTVSIVSEENFCTHDTYGVLLDGEALTVKFNAEESGQFITPKGTKKESYLEFSIEDVEIDKYWDESKFLFVKEHRDLFIALFKMYMSNKELPVEIFNFFSENAHDISYQCADFFLSISQDCVAASNEEIVLHNLELKYAKAENPPPDSYLVYQINKENYYIQAKDKENKKRKRNKCYKVEVKDKKEQNYFLENFNLIDEFKEDDDFNIFEESKENKVFEISGEDGFIPIHASYFWIPGANYLIIPKDSVLTFSIKENSPSVCNLIIATNDSDKFNKSRVPFSHYTKTGVFIQIDGFTEDKVEVEKDKYGNDSKLSMPVFSTCILLKFKTNSTGQLERVRNELPVVIRKEKNSEDKAITDYGTIIYHTGNPTFIYHVKPEK